MSLARPWRDGEPRRCRLVDELGEAVSWTASLPAHVNVNTLEPTPTRQAAGPFQIVRDQA